MQPQNVISEPRSFLATAMLMGLATGPAFGLLWGPGLAYLEGSPASDAWLRCLAGGAFFGIFFGLIMAALFRGETATVPAAPEPAFVRRLDVATAEVSYFPASRAAGYYVYKPSLRAGLLAGRISVAVGDGTATIVGPKLYVGRLLKRLRDGAAAAT